MMTSTSRVQHIRRAITLVLGVLFVAVSIAFAPAAQAAEVTDTIDGITYTADNSVVADGATVTAYDNSSPIVDIRESVTLDGTEYDVTTIADEAFRDMSLDSVIIGNNVTTLGARAFFSAGITTLTLGTGLTTINEGAFANNSISDVTIPDNVTTLDARAFFSAGVTTLTLGTGLTTITFKAFENNDISNLTIPDSVTTVDDYAFFDNAIESLAIPSSVTTIGSNAFGFNSLDSVTIPESVTTLGNQSFRENNLTNVTIPGSVTSIGSNAFTNNLGLTSVKFLGPAPTITSDSFGAPTGKTLRYPYAQPIYTTPTWFGYTTKPYGTVTFDPDGGVPEPGDQEVDLGDTVTEPADPTKPGLVFLGWFSDALFTLLYDFADAFSGDLTLFAKYGTAPTLTGSPTAEATVDTPFSYVPTVTGDPAPIITSASTLPAGLGLDPDSGVISGTPVDIAGSYPIALTATSAAGMVNLDVTITLSAGPVAALTLEASDTTPDQGDTIDITASGTDAGGNDLGDVTADVTLTSDVATDDVDGTSVTFNHASPHTITATHTPTGVSEDIVIDVAPTPEAALPDTGATVAPAGLALATLLLIAGLALLVSARIPALAGKRRA